MKRKQLILRLVDKLPDDVSYERVIYHLGVMQAAEQGLAEIEQGKGLDHDQVFEELLCQDEENQDHLGPAREAGSGEHTKIHRPKRSPKGARVRSPAQKSG